MTKLRPCEYVNYGKAFILKYKVDFFLNVFDS